MLRSWSPQNRWLLFGLWLICSVVISWKAFHSLLQYSLGNDDASHILLIPLVSGWLLYLDRQKIFAAPSSDLFVSAIFLLPGIACALRSLGSAPASQSMCALGLVLLWISGFALVFGRAALKAAQFPLLFLLLFIPLPDFFLNKIVYFLQRGSAEISALLFGLTGLPVLREGFVFRLPRFSIEVARECSGIRSSIALLVLAILVGHFFLRKLWKQSVFVLAGIVVMIVKNGIRIVTLTLLANYVDPGFLFGSLHRQGGVVFFIIGLLLLVPVFWLLQRNETSTDPSDTPVITGPAAVL
jgi:exosortase